MVAPIIATAARVAATQTAKSKAKKKAKRSAKEVAYRREASRKAALANKRIARLEKNGLQDTPAYKQFIDSGHEKFSVRGKTYRELQKEVSRMNKFINSRSSTVKGAQSIIKEIADNTGIKYKNLKELRAKADKFFELESKIKQYLRTVDDMASAIGYQQIWTAINEYTDEAKVDLTKASADVEDMVEAVTKALRQQEDPVKAKLDVDDSDDFNWFTL